MATGWLNNISEGHFYIGAAKQAAWGTALAPTWFHRWLDGTTADPMVNYSEDIDGDDGEAGFAWKVGQYWQIVVMERVRPQTCGYAFQGAFRSGSDTYTAPTKSTTLGANILVGDTTFQTNADIGNTGNSVGLNFSPAYSATNYEVAVADLTTRTGPSGGKYTYTLAAAGTFKMAHTSADVVTNVSTHVFTPQVAPFSPYSYEFGWGNTAFGLSKALRTTNAVCKQVRISGQKGQPLVMQHTWWASNAIVQAALSNPITYETANAVGRAGSPFKWYDGTVYKLNGGTTLNAATMESFDLTFDNDITWDDLQSEQISAPYFIPGNYKVQGSTGFVFTDFSQYNDALFGSTTGGTGATDSTSLGRESAEVKFALDAVNTLDLSVPNIYFQAPKLAPKRSGHGLHQQLQFSAIRPTPDMTPTTNVTVTLGNSSAAAY